MKADACLPRPPQIIGFFQQHRIRCHLTRREDPLPTSGVIEDEVAPPQAWGSPREVNFFKEIASLSDPISL
jgi:hypothetical protein